ncbi:MAG: Hsp70 family protein [Oligoflexales bacterium]
MSVLGIDLGTSNSAMALCPEAKDAKAYLLNIPQVSVQQQIGVEEKLLPSVLYACDESEKALLKLKGNDTYVAGVFAREKAYERPDRAILSAKSWLSASYADRLQPILPMGSECVEKLSPVDASISILKQLESAWVESAQDIKRTVVTVPASFDETARQLTMKAIQATSFPKVSLLEEPQAAFYAWLAQNENWRDQVQPGDVILVCDIGGGTTDMTLVLVQEKNGEVELERIAVGQHLLLGGDNMDLALAMKLAQDLGALDHWQIQSLVQSCRIAKEKLWNDDSLSEIKVSVAARSAKLFAKTLSTTLTRDTLNEFILEGFFPKIGVESQPMKSRQSGLRDMGLRYVQDPAITKHIAEFLVSSLRSLKDTEYSELLQKHMNQGFVSPNAILFNGGVFKAETLRQRVVQVVSSWGNYAVTPLMTESLDSAVAYGAAVYGQLCESGEGIRVRAGTSHSYYLGVEAPGMAIPGMTPRINGVCVVPQGTEEGSSVMLDQKTFGLVVGEPVEFQFFQSSQRASDHLGAVVGQAEQVLDKAGCLTMTIPLDESHGREVIPVLLKSYVSELGVLELSLKHTLSERSWKLEFDVRAE